MADTPNSSPIGQTEYRLGSNEAVYAPGIVAWAISGYWNEADREYLRGVVSLTWRIPDAAVDLLLSKAVSYTIEGETLVFIA